MKFYYGAQYYRPPTPPETDWERDFGNMKKANFNIIKIWAMWRWHNPGEGEYYWHDLDRLMELAKEYDFSVIINIIFDTAPAWFCKKYPDSRVITASGEVLQPTSNRARQIGGNSSVCFQHPEYIKATGEFLKNLVKKYREHPCLLVWDLWNEPYLPAGVFFDGPMSETTCYCDNTKKEFILWLKQKYGNIKNLNKCWARSYNDFSEVEIPNSYATCADLCDFRIFMMSTVTNELKRRKEIVRELDNKHKVMTHAGFSCVIWDPIFWGNDDWALSDEVDIYGGSFAGAWRERWTRKELATAYESVPVEVDGIRSAAEGKEIWSSEFQAYTDGAFRLYGDTEKNHVERWIAEFIGLGANKAIVYWQYRVELLGNESPGWGITNLDGSGGQKYKDVADIGRVMKKYGDKIVRAKIPKNQVAVVYNPDAYIVSWMGRKCDFTVDIITTVKGFYRALYLNSIGCDFIHAYRSKDKIFDYKVVILPYSYVLDKNFANILTSYVKKGGILISEAQLGSFQREDSMHSLRIPGYGLDKVFGCEELNWIDTNEKINIKTTDGDSILGFGVKEVLRTTKGGAIGSYEKNQPAVIRNSFGKGKTIFFGSYIGQPIIEYNCFENIAYLGKLLTKFGVKKKIEFKSTGKVHGDILSGEGYDILIFVNCENKTNKVVIEKTKKYRLVEDIYKDRQLKNKQATELSLESWGCRMIIGYY